MINKKIKIIHTPVRFYPAVGGVENHVFYLSEQLVQKGIEVEVVAANVPPSDVKNIKGIKITRLKSLFNITNTNITIGLPLYLLFSQFDIIHTHMPTPWTCDWSVIIGKIKRKKTVLTIHNDIQKLGYLSKLITDVYLNVFFRITLYLVDKIIIVNPQWESSFFYTRHLLRPHIKKIEIIPNGVDTTIFKKTTSTKKNTLLFVSILDKYHWFKGINVAINAIEQIRKIIPSIHMIVVGEGELKNKYEKEVLQKNLSDNIQFVGYKNQNELPDYFSSAEIFILPSTDTEGFGIVLLESLACGTPVITTEIAGIAEDIKSANCGLVIQTNNSTQLAQSILDIIKDSTLREQMSKNSVELIHKFFSWDVVSEAIMELYKRILK